MKNLKKISKLVIFSLLFYCPMANAQWIVSDPSAQVSLIESVQNGLKQIQVSEQQLETATDAMKQLEQVNSRIKEIKMATAILNNLKETSSIFSSLPSKMNNIQSDAIKRELSGMISSEVDVVEVYTELFNSSLKDSYFNMGDYERLKLMMEIYEKSGDLKRKAIKLDNSIRRYTF